MADSSWPVSVNTTVINYKPSAPVVDIISDPADVGDPKERPRYNGFTQYHQWSMIMTIAEFEAFKAWYLADLSAGVKSFSFARPASLSGFNGKTGNMELVFVKENGIGFSIDGYNHKTNKVSISFRVREI